MAKLPASDESVKRATGRDWAAWCRLLDAEGAQKMAHGDIARMADEKVNGGDSSTGSGPAHNAGW